MYKVKYTFTALQPIFTGADEDFGTERKLIRERVIIKNPIVIKSKFKNEFDRRNAILKVLKNIWKNIDMSTMSNSRIMGIYDEFASKLLASTCVQTKYQFLNEMCYKFGIRSLNDEEIIDILNNFPDEEFLTTIRYEHQYLILLLRRMNKEKIKLENLFDEKIEQVEDLIFTKNYESIPLIQGNTIRGELRRIAMYDFFKTVGITKLSKIKYHQYFTGGQLSSMEAIDIDVKEEEIKNCPMLGLFGSAIGNMTIEGELLVSAARPKCKEHGNGELSYWELLGKRFQTRLDSSKTERDIEIVGADIDITTQMKYEYEVFNKGTQFEHQFVLRTENPIIVSAFNHMLKLFTENNFIAGNSARDMGEIDLTELKQFIDEEESKKYINYLLEHKEEIKNYFNKDE